MLGTIIVIGGGAAAVFVFARHNRRQRVEQRAGFIDEYRFPNTIPSKVRDRYPHLTDAQVGMVMSGLRQYFHLCNVAAGSGMLAMPSQAVDVAWHEFILFTRTYQLFCQKALGRFLHHTPAEAMRSPTSAQYGIRRTWRYACKRERIAPGNPSRLPLLFALDALLSIPDGFRYSLDCSKPDSHPYCASDIGCGGSGCGGDFGDSSSGHHGNDHGGDSGGGDGGSDGGGCGGGCGGD